MAALENNNLGMSNSEDQAVTQNENTQALDLSTADSPLDPLNEYNLDNIQAQNDSVEQGTPPVNNTPQDPPTKKKVYTDADIKALDQRQRKSMKEWGDYGAMASVSSYVDANQAARVISFDSKKTRLDRYLGYGTETFNKVGFSPFANNEEVFNKNTTMWQDYKRMSGNAAALTWLGFKQNFAFGIFDWDTEEENTRKYQEYSDIGMSTKGGVGQFGNNLILNMGYGIGVGYSILTEEALMLGADYLSLGTLTPAVAARTATNMTKLAKLRSVFNMAASNGFKSVKLAGAGLDVFKSLKGAENAKGFYTSVKTLGKATGNFINPLSRLTDEVLTGSNAVRNASNMAKMSKSFGAFYRDMRDINVALGESKLEGGTKKQEVIDFEIAKYKEANGRLPEGKDLETLYAKAEDIYKGVVGINLPIIYYTNRITFDGLFKFKGFKTLEQAGNSATLSGKGIKFTAGKGFSTEAAKKWYQLSVRKYPGMAWNYGKRNISEGIQENLQNVISDGVGDYYNAVYKDPTLGGFNFAAATAVNNLQKEFTSARGAETFLTGFLMGAVAGPAQSVFLTETPGLYYRGKDLVMRTNDFKAYKAKKADQIKEKVATLNELYKNPLDFFNSTQENAASQNAAYTTLMQSEDNGDTKTFQDTKDISLFNHVFTSINNGTFDDLIDGYKQMSKLDPKELADYLKIQDVTKAKDKIQEVIKRAEEIQSTYKKVNEKFENPFNPSAYNTDDENYKTEAISYVAFEKAKRTLAMAEHGFQRSVERMQSLYQDISTDRPIGKSANNDYSVLLNTDDINNEIAILRSELKSYGPESQQDADQKKIVKQKTQRLEDLQEYRDNLGIHLESIKTQETIQNGQFIIQPTSESYTNLRNTYKKYLKNIAKLSGDYVFDDKIDNSFDKLLDYYSLDNDAKNLSNAINTLIDPSTFYKYAESINKILKEQHDNMDNFHKEQMESYSRREEQNSLITELAKLGIIISPEDFIDYVTYGKRPTQFFDADTKRPIEPDSEKYKDAQHAFDVDDQIKNRPAPSTPNDASTPGAPVTPTSTEAEPTIEEELVAAGVSEEEQALRKAYSEHLSKNPDADVTYDEFVAQSPKASQIKKDFAQKKAEPAAAEPFVEVIERPTPVTETPVVEEEVAAEPVEETPVESVEDNGTKMVQDLLNSVSSIRDLPNLNSSVANTLTTKIISLMRDNPGIKASDVAAMIDVKRKEFIENLQTSDLKPGDIVTFADGKKGMVKKASNEEVTIKMPKVKDALVLNQEDLSKRITMVEAGTVAKAKKQAPVEITESDKVEVEASKDAVDGFTSNAAKVQELNKDILANTGKDNSANVNNLIDKLGCKTNAKK